MAEIGNEICVGCSTDVGQQGKRRLLHSAGTQHDLSDLQSLMLPLFMEENVKRVVPDVSRRSAVFRVYEVFQKLREVHKSEERLGRWDSEGWNCFFIEEKPNS